VASGGRINIMKIQFTEIALAFDFVSFARPYENQAFLNMETGEIYWQSAFGDNEEDLPDDIDDEKYIEIPHKNDLGLGKPLALDFIYKHLPGESEKIETIFRRKGAYSKFKAVLEHNGVIEKWYEYESRAQENALREWCKLSELDTHG
jgi:hypothetical protein